MIPAENVASVAESLDEGKSKDAARGLGHGAILLGSLAIYFGLHALTRSILSGNLQLDEAEQLVLTQDWRWGYGSQPPLYTWLQKGMFALLGVKVAALALLKNALLWIAYAFTFLSAREALNNARLAAVAAASLLFFPQIAWESQRDQSHLVLATAFAAATLYFFLRLIKTRSAEMYGLFGAAVAFGFLSKYNYVIVVGALILALLLSAHFRPAALSWKMLIAAAVFLLLAGPHIVWMLSHQGAVKSQSYKFGIGLETGIASHASGIWQWLKACVGIGIAPLMVFLPFLPRQFSGSGMRRAFESCQPLAKLLIKAFVISLVLILALTIIFRVTHLRDRWLQPIFFALPIWLVSLARPRLGSPQTRGLMALAAIVSVTVLFLVNGTVLAANTLNRPHNLNIPYERLARELRQEGFEKGTIIANGFLLGGNLKKQFPESCVVQPHLDDKPSGAPTLIVWDARNEAVPEEFMQIAAKFTRIPRSEMRPRYVEAPCRNGPRQSERLGFVLVGETVNGN